MMCVLRTRTGTQKKREKGEGEVRTARVGSNERVKERIRPAVDGRGREEDGGNEVS